MRIMTCIEDLRRVARRKVPRAFFDYAEAGSYAQETLRANREDLEHIKLRQRVLVDVSQRDLTTTILGERVSLPLALAPIGLCGMMHGDGEILACRAAQAAGIPFTLSTMSICSIEAGGGAAEAVCSRLYGGPWLHLLDRGAAAAKCSARWRSTCRGYAITRSGSGNVRRDKRRQPSILQQPLRTFDPAGPAQTSATPRPRRAGNGTAGNDRNRPIRPG
jgi:hypothetical protein